MPVRQQLVGVGRLVARARRGGRRSRGCAPRTSTPVPAGGRPERRHPWPDSLRAAPVRRRPVPRDVWRGAAALRDAWGRAHHDGRRGRARGRGRPGAGPGLLLVHGFGGAKEDFADHVAACSRDDHTVVVVRPSWPRRERRARATRRRTPSIASSPTCSRSPTRSASTASACSATRWAGWSRAGSCSAHPERVEALILMDTAPGPIPASTPSSWTSAAEVALDAGQGRAEGAARRRRRRSNTPAYERVLAERPGYQEFQDRKWDALSEVMWAAIVRGDRAPGRRPPRVRDASRARRSSSSASWTQPFLAPSHAMADAIPDAELVGHPRRRSLAAVREPRRVDRRAAGVPRRAASRRAS